MTLPSSMIYTPSLVRPKFRTPPTVLQLCPLDEQSARLSDAIALALCQTDEGRKIYGVDDTGALFILGAHK
jgi:hypothetical protein